MRTLLFVGMLGSVQCRLCCIIPSQETETCRRQVSVKQCHEFVSESLIFIKVPGRIEEKCSFELSRLHWNQNWFDRAYITITSPNGYWKYGCIKIGNRIMTEYTHKYSRNIASHKEFNVPAIFQLILKLSRYVASIWE